MKEPSYLKEFKWSFQMAVPIDSYKKKEKEWLITFLKRNKKKIKLTYFKEVEWSFQIAVSINSYKKKKGGTVNNVQNSRIYKKKIKEHLLL